MLQLLRQVDVEAARKGQHEVDDVGRDVVVIDLAEIGDGLTGARSARDSRSRLVAPPGGAPAASAGAAPQPAPRAGWCRRRRRHRRCRVPPPARSRACSTRTPISSAAMLAAQLLLMASCGGSITSVNATFFMRLASTAAIRYGFSHIAQISAPWRLRCKN